MLLCVYLITITLQVWVHTDLCLFDYDHHAGMGHLTASCIFNYNHPAGMGASLLCVYLVTITLEV